MSLGRVLPCVLKDQSAFLFRAKHSKKNEYLFFKWWPIRFSETSRTTRQMMHRHISKDWSPISFVFRPFFLLFLCWTHYAACRLFAFCVLEVSGFVSCPVDRLPWLFSSCRQANTRRAPLVMSRPCPWTSLQIGLPFDAIRCLLLIASLSSAPLSGTIRWQHQPTPQIFPSHQSAGKKPSYRNFYRGYPVVFSEL